MFVYNFRPGVEFTVGGFPPTYDPSFSILNPQHRHYSRVQKLQAAAKKAMGGNKPFSRIVTMEIFYRINKGNYRMDTINIIGAIANVLQGIVYEDDNQVREIHYREYDAAGKDVYKVIVYELE